MKIDVELNPIGEYVAIDYDTYDCDCDQDGFFSTSPVGHGETKNEAIRDLLEQMEDRGLIGPDIVMAELAKIGE